MTISDTIAGSDHAPFQNRPTKKNSMTRQVILLCEPMKIHSKPYSTFLWLLPPIFLRSPKLHNKTQVVSDGGGCATSVPLP